MHSRFFSSLLIASSMLSSTAMAQMNDNAAAMDRMDRIERDINMLQRQVSRSGSGTYSASSADAGPVGNAAQLEVRLSGLEEEIRSLRGKVEENDFQTRKLNDTLERMQKDIEFRFNELSQKPAPQTGQGVIPVTPKADNKKIDTEEETAKLAKSDIRPDIRPDMKPEAKADGKPSITSGGDGVLRADSDGDGTPRDQYNQAFRLLNQTQYEDAAHGFENFIQKYPKDPLIGNAYYWLGETHYIRRDYVNAADSFRQGFESLPSGPKAADNLLKLAMSLNALKRDKEACIVLQQIGSKFQKTSTSVVQKAEQEQKRIGCN